MQATTSGSRHIAACVRRAVWRRDEGRCAFVGPQGRCTATAFLEFHHIVPFAAGGTATVENIELRCRAHNQREAELYFGTQLPLLVRETSGAYGELGPNPVRRATSSIDYRMDGFAASIAGPGCGAPPLFLGRRIGSWAYSVGSGR